MRCVHAALLFAVSISPALAQRAPEIVIPSRPDVPILMNGIDVSWSVIEGDFGLDRPGEMTPTIIYPPAATPYVPSYQGPGYFPKDGRRPGYGRLEVAPPRNRRLPPPAPSYYRSWSAGSAPGPIAVPPVNPYYAPPGGATTDGWSNDSSGNGPSGQSFNGSSMGWSYGTPQDYWPRTGGSKHERRANAPQHRQHDHR